MKNRIVIGLLLLLIISIFNVNIYAHDQKENSSLSIEQAIQETRFFEVFENKHAIESQGTIFVDTVNGYDHETIDLLGTTVEHEAIKNAYELSSDLRINDLNEKYKKSFATNELSNYKSLLNFIKSDSTDDFSENYITSEVRDYIIDLLTIEKISNPNNIELRIGSLLYYEMYVGSYENITKTDTWKGHYTLYGEYREVFSGYQAFETQQTSNAQYRYEYVGHSSYGYEYAVYKRIYTGATKLILNSHLSRHLHLQVLEFNYRSFNFYFEELTAPEANITLIYNYKGEEYMILESSSIGEPFVISRRFHYDRNQFNVINGIPVEEVYPQENSQFKMFSGFTKASQTGSYYHQLLVSNNNNVKYTKDVTYYDAYTGYRTGSLEIVFDQNGNVEFEDLVTFTFNLATFASYDEPWSIITNGHWIQDVYPYLIWGNSPQDYLNHSAYERFVWDKDSSVGFINWLIKGKNKQGIELTSLYESGEIGDAWGTPIPNAIKNDSYVFIDTVAPNFTVISTEKTIYAGLYTDIDWTNYMYNLSDNNYGNVTKYEIYDNVIYYLPGKYYVLLAARDDSGNEKTVLFTVRVIFPGC